MNGDARSTNRLNKSEELLVFGFFSITESAVTVDDEVSRSRIEFDDTLGCLDKTICDVYTFMITFLYCLPRPLRPWVDTIWISADMRICKQGNSVLIQPDGFATRGHERGRRRHTNGSKYERVFSELTTSDRWKTNWHIMVSLSQCLSDRSFRSSFNTSCWNRRSHAINRSFRPYRALGCEYFSKRRCRGQCLF